MTSEERREQRYIRRKRKREEKRKRVLEQHGNFYDVVSRDALSRSAHDATKGVRYKASVKRFMLRRLINIANLSDKLIYGKDVRKGFICFNLMERGKLRKIMSVHFSERVVQKSLNQNALVPVMTRSLIHDNGASQRGKGTSFAMKRLVTHLRRHYRKYGREGYILLIDFSDYFGSIDHELAKKMIAEYFEDNRIIWLTNMFIDAYYEHFVMLAKRNGEDPAKVERKGIGLGSEINQTIAISYPNRMDHYVKEVLRIQEYERYMDDSYLIHIDKGYLEHCLIEIRRICSELKITINEKKTGIIKLSHGFVFLKTQIYLTETGKIIRKPCRKAVTRQRRKIKKQAKLVEAGTMSYEDAKCSYVSARGCMEKKTARRTLYSMDCLFNRLFIQNWMKGGMPNG